MPKICDNTSVGVLIYRGDQLLMIERHNYPKAYALPAGHCDGDSFEKSAKRESKEEVGLAIVISNPEFTNEVENPCKRQGGDHHSWKVYRTLEWSGKVKAGSDAKRFFWASPKEVKRLAKRTEYFMEKYEIPYSRVGELTLAIFGNPQSAEQNRTDEEWYWGMGLEPVWYYIIKNIGII
ncbi:MAG: NUDIX domain-containing protein [Patescibacteria group bacterium]